LDLRETTQDQQFRAEARAWLSTNLPNEMPSGDTAEGFALHLQWEKKLFEAGWAVVSWPKAYGGRQASLRQWLIFEEEYYRVGAPQRVTQNGIFLLAPTLFEFGTQSQKDCILPAMAGAETLWAQAWSEPGSGSDLASIRSRAERVEGGWRLYGQKTWCTRAAFCDACFGLFRSDPDSSRHHGLTYFMAPLQGDGVEVRGFGRLDGDEGFAEVFFDGLFVSDDAVIGDVDSGWSVAMATTSSERGLTLRSPGRFSATAQRLEALYQSGADDPLLEARVLDAALKAESYRLFTDASVTAMSEGQSLGARSSLMKVFWSELDIEMHETAMAILGDDAALESPWTKAFQFSLGGPIYAGTNEIQRNIIAERVLGLPRK
jgi:alkylation response protein AidB-like acyl-CoA dehydrogenase